jgi:hypothetical protein
MLRTGVSRRLIALVAAYGLALQAMLAGVVVAAPDAAFPAVICAPDHHLNAVDTRDPPTLPAPGHGSDCPFCLLACGGSTTLPSGVPTAVRFHGAAAPMPPWRSAAPASRVMPRAGLARAPPA